MKKIYIAVNMMECNDVEDYIPENYTKTQIIAYLDNKLSKNKWLVYNFEPFNQIDYDNPI